MSRTSKRSPNVNKRQSPSAQTSWDPVAHWYAQWVGVKGSEYHHALAIPVALELLDPAPNEVIIDIGCGTGVFASALPRGVQYIGVDASPRLLQTARRLHAGRHEFLQGDATRLMEVESLRPRMADAAVFLLSIQDMEPLEDILAGAGTVLKESGRLVILMFHPCFRIPRQSGWGWDEGRALQYRRVDSYLSNRSVPVRPIAKGMPGSITAFHRPLEAYINGLTHAGFTLDRIVELPAYPHIKRSGRRARAENRANQEIPLFLALRAIRNHR